LPILQIHKGLWIFEFSEKIEKRPVLKGENSEALLLPPVVAEVLFQIIQLVHFPSPWRNCLCECVEAQRNLFRA